MTGARDTEVLLATIRKNPLCVTKIVPCCSVVDTDLILGDIITSINEDLISGMTIEEAWPLLWGQMNSSVELMITRLVGGVKRRLTIDAVRDYDPSPEVPNPPPLGSSTALVEDGSSEDAEIGGSSS